MDRPPPAQKLVAAPAAGPAAPRHAAPRESAQSARERNRDWRIAAVRYFNTLPLIDGLAEIAPEASLTPRVPSALLDELVTGRADAALCPVIDYFRSPRPLAIAPVGGIGCDGPTLTVRLFSQSRLDRLKTIAVDTDSHTSVTLLRILYRRKFGQNPRLQPLKREPGRDAAWPEAMLLIGDKVVLDEPDPRRYIHQLDLGEAWHDMTGLPFVFAAWMVREGEAVDPLLRLLDRLREANAPRREAIAEAHAAERGWPVDVARRYLARLLRYEIGEAQREAIARFAAMAAEVGAIPHVGELRWREPG